jgi:tetratricopeptide (TPR) repeat protein
MGLGLRMIFGVVAVILAASSCMAQSTEPSDLSKQLAKTELNEAAASYREGKFADAQAHSQNALALDPTNRTALMFVARTIHAQYRPGNFTYENIAKGREAITAYRQILEQNPQDEEAYKAIAYLFGALKDDDAQKQWILGRATDISIEPTKRAEAYTVLASKNWDCSFKRTELPGSKEEVMEGTKSTVRYHMPRDVKVFEEAKQCASQALNFADMAISLDPENESAWSYKTNSLLEQAKLSQMANDEVERRRLLNEYNVALKETTRISRTNQEKDASEQRPAKKSTP